MFLQQFVYSPDALARLSRHAETGATLPAETVAALVAAKRLQQGYATARYVAMCKYDLAMHGSPGAAAADGAAAAALDGAAAPDGAALAALWRELYASRVGLEEHPDAHMASTWYHMAIGCARRRRRPPARPLTHARALYGEREALGDAR